MTLKHGRSSAWNKEDEEEEEEADLDGITPAHNERGVVFPTQAAGVHVRPQTHVIPQHVGDPLLCAEVIDFYSLGEKKENDAT